MRRAIHISAILAGFALVFAAAAAPAYADGETKVITATNSSLSDHQCNDSEWHFVINQIAGESQAPDSITVTWSNGATQTVPHTMLTDQVGHYTTTADLDSGVTRATATIYAEWNGEFVLSHGPCGQPSNAPDEKGDNEEGDQESDVEGQQKTRTETACVAGMKVTRTFVNGNLVSVSSTGETCAAVGVQLGVEQGPTGSVSPIVEQPAGEAAQAGAQVAGQQAAPVTSLPSTSTDR